MPGLTPHDRCRSERCRAPIKWARSATTGDMVPLDPDPTPDGNLDLVDGKVFAYGLEGVAAKRPRYQSHFATCPDAPQFRRARKSGDDAGAGRARRRR